MPAQITTLIDWLDGYEIARDEVAAILAVESAGQVAIATTASHPNPELWQLDVYTERDLAIEKWLQATPGTFYPPIVNVWLESVDFPKKTSTVRGERSRPVINIDCYGLGFTQAAAGGGHLPGDEDASRACQRATRQVRNILEAEHYTYLGSPQEKQSPGNQWCFGREVTDIKWFQPQLEKKAAQRIVGARVQLEVRAKVQVPTVVAQNINFIHAEIRRDTDNKLLVQGDYEFAE